MVGMNDSTRRLIMMLTIILAGTAVTFLELSPIVVFVISLLIGIVMLFGLKILSFDELKEDLFSFRERLNQPISLKKTGEEKPEIVKEALKKETEDKKREIPFSGLIEKLPFYKGEGKENQAPGEKLSPFSGVFAKIRPKGKKDDKTKEIDELLDKTINEPVIESDQSGEVSAGTETEIEEDDFSEFDSLELGLEDEEFEFGEGPQETDEDIKSAPDVAGGSMEDEIPDSAIAEILAKEGIDLDLESDDEFPEMDSEDDELEAEKENSEELSKIDDLDGDISGFDLEDDELEEFDQIDLDEIEPEEDLDLEEDDEVDIEIGDSDEDVQDVVVSPPDESDDLFAAPPKEWSQTKTVSHESSESFDESGALSFGGEGDDEDLFAMLKADTKKAVTVQESSLVRDLKDANVEGRELVDGLESVLHQLGVKVEKIEEDGESNPDSTDEDNDNRG